MEMIKIAYIESQEEERVAKAIFNFLKKTENTKFNVRISKGGIKSNSLYLKN
jgi:hypothetical protein